MRSSRPVESRDRPATRVRGPWEDPRAVVAVVAAGAIALVGIGAWAVTSSMARDRSDVAQLAGSIEPPMEDLLRTERANNEGQQALYGAAATTGADRTRLLSESIVASQEASAAWSEYRDAALDLPRAAELARRYEIAQEQVQDLSSELLIPIVNSPNPATLPVEQIGAHQTAERALRDLHEVYRDAERTELAALDSSIGRSDDAVTTVGGVLLAVIVLVAAVGLRRGGRAHQASLRRRQEQRLVAFDSRLRRALELTDSEASAYRIAERAVTEMAPQSRVSILVSDSSRSALHPVGGAPACGVTSPGECPALRSTSVVEMVDSTALDACPVLAEHGEAPCSATCVPVTVGGRSGGLIQVVGPEGEPTRGADAAILVARGVGDRVTLIQALATFQLQAARDPLTGLLNRRSLVVATEGLLERGDPYSVAFCDLDHFKELNDLHGHDAGDRALRSFARTLTESLRPQDIVCRWGGEEFVIVLPDCDAAAAVEAMERVRTNLLLTSMSSHTASFTASFGVATSADGATFDDVVALADLALREAKGTGRDRVIRSDSLPSGSGGPEMPTAERRSG